MYVTPVDGNMMKLSVIPRTESLPEREDLPEDFVCPVCGVDKEMFSKAE